MFFTSGATSSSSVLCEWTLSTGSLNFKICGYLNLITFITLSDFFISQLFLGSIWHPRSHLHLGKYIVSLLQRQSIGGECYPSLTPSPFLPHHTTHTHAHTHTQTFAFTCKFLINILTHSPLSRNGDAALQPEPVILSTYEYFQGVITQFVWNIGPGGTQDWEMTLIGQSPDPNYHSAEKNWNSFCFGIYPHSSMYAMKCIS